MELVICRVLKYLNGCLEDDYMYKVGNYIVKYYSDICFHNHPCVSDDETFTTEELLKFCQRLGYKNIDDFEHKLKIDNQYRLELIHERMMNLDLQPMIDHLEVDSKEDFKKQLNELYELMDRQKRIVIVGGPYSNSISVDFQTDMITLGKEVTEYHRFDKNFNFTKDDIVIFMTATGRTMEYYISEIVPKSICEAYIILVTQNIKYVNYENVCADYVIHVKGKFDGIQFNYQMMLVFDLLRIGYYQKYYVAKKKHEFVENTK